MCIRDRSGSVKDIFANPRTEAARKLVFPASSMTTPIVGKRLVRMVFDGMSTFEPVDVYKRQCIAYT